jgi:hypothetical protein
MGLYNGSAELLSGGGNLVRERQRRKLYEKDIFML